MKPTAVHVSDGSFCSKCSDYEGTLKKIRTGVWLCEYCASKLDACEWELEERTCYVCSKWFSPRFPCVEEDGKFFHERCRP